MSQEQVPVLWAKGALYGYCPKCGAPGECRSLEGVDRCQHKHVYPSLRALPSPKGRRVRAKLAV